MRLLSNFGRADARADEYERARALELRERGLHRVVVPRTLERDVERCFDHVVRHHRHRQLVGMHSTRTEPFAQRAPRFMGLAHDDVVDTLGLQRRDRQEADRPTASDEPARPWSGASATRDAVQHDGHRLRERGVLRCEVVGDPQQLARGDRLVARERALPFALVSSTRPRSVHSEGRCARQYSQRPHLAPGPPTTRSPTAQPSTSSPVATTVPLYSWPSIAPSCPPHSMRKCRSEPQIPQWLTSMSTSCSPSGGVGRSSTVTSRRPMNTAAGIDSGRRRPSPKGHPNLTRASTVAHRPIRAGARSTRRASRRRRHW